MSQERLLDSKEEHHPELAVHDASATPETKSEVKEEPDNYTLATMFDDVKLDIPVSKGEEMGIKDEEVVGGELELKPDVKGKVSLARTPTVKKAKVEPILVDHLPSAKDEALLAFQEIEHCLYIPGYLGDAGQEEIMSCDCKPDYGADGTNHACGPDSDCINRMTSIECTDDECNCGDACQNQRFQLREYAAIDVFHAGKKGYGLRALADFPKDVFVYEYVGEVIGEKKFRQRQVDYKVQGEQHFYFMMLQKGEYIDATRKGGFGRFINHSCEPNCYVDKWVVGNKLRMGIFTKRSIVQGEELTFDYNVDRYGGEATPCYCGEPTCLGYIGGKTQTEAANKLSQNVAEALGLDDDEDWDDAKPKKNRRRKKGEDDEEYVNDLTPRAILEKDVPKIMGTLLQATERWLLRKLLQRIANDADEKIQAKIVLLHGYQTLGAKLDKWKDDTEICILILQILQKWPSMTKNKISSSKIEIYVKALAVNEKANEEVKSLSSQLLEIWGNLEMAYRIPRRVRPPKPVLSAEEKAKKEEEARAQDSSNSAAARTPVRPPRRDQPWRRHDHNRDKRSTPRPAAPTPTPQPATPKVDPLQDLQAIIDAATKKQEEQAQLLKLQEIEKAEAEEQRLADEAEKRAERARKHERHKLEKEKRAAAKRAKKKDQANGKSKHKIGKTNGAHESDEKKLERIFARFVPNVTVKYREKLGRDQFKKRVRELVKMFVAKELKRDKPDLGELSDAKKSKIKAFAKEFMEKVVKHHLAKQAEKAADTLADNDNAGSSKAVSSDGSASQSESDSEDGSMHEGTSPTDEPATALEAEINGHANGQEKDTSIGDSTPEVNGHANNKRIGEIEDENNDERASKREKLA